MLSILNKAYLPIVDIIKARSSSQLSQAPLPGELRKRANFVRGGGDQVASLDPSLLRTSKQHSQAKGCDASFRQRSSGVIKDLLLAPHKYKDLNLISILNNTAASACAKLVMPSARASSHRKKLLGDCSNTKQIHNTIYNSIGYKNMRGIRLEIKGRLTKRYRADRSIYSLK